MATPTIESESNNGAPHDEQSSSSFDSNQISSDEQLTQIIDSINGEETTTSTEEATPSPAPRTAGQTAIGAKLVKKLETLGQRKIPFPTGLIELSRLAASTKEVKPAAAAVATATTASANNDSDSRRNINKTASMNL